MITLSLTTEEAQVVISLMQAGARSFVGPQFDQAAGSYLHLTKKIADAANAKPGLELVNDADAA